MTERNSFGKFMKLRVFFIAKANSYFTFLWEIVLLEEILELVPAVSISDAST